MPKMQPLRQKVRRKCDPFARKCTPDPRVENATPSSENAHLTRAGRQKCNPFNRKCVENATPSSINALRPPSLMGKYIGNVPHLLDINATCTDIKFPDARRRQGQRRTKVRDVRCHLGTSWVSFTSTSLSFSLSLLFPLLLLKN